MTVFRNQGMVPSGGSGDDHQSGYYEIITGNTVTIAQYKQSVVFGPFILDGTIQIDGQLILEI